jgi:hypothetical protein
MSLTNPGRMLAVIVGSAMLATLAPMPRASGQEAEPPRKEIRGKWFPLFQRHAGEYAVRVLEPEIVEARMLPEPVFRWQQPVRGGDDGALYLWVIDGRPVAAITFFTFKFPDGVRMIVHERHSFVTEPIEATWRGRVVMRTSKPGVAFRPVPDAPGPAAAAPARLRQMQAIARDFTANTVDDKGQTWPLRPLARPLYRHESDRDGALFAFVQGTDPEAFLLLRVAGTGPEAKWEYAVTRFTDLENHVRHKGLEVFSGPHTTGAMGEIYHSDGLLTKKSDSPEDFR